MRTNTIAHLTGGVHISASALRTLIECPREFFIGRMLAAPPEHLSARMVLGSACHAAIATFYEALRDGDAEPVVSDLAEVAHRAIEGAAAGSVPLLFDEDEELDTLKSEARRLLSVFLAGAFRPARVLAVEEPFVIELTHPVTGETPRPEKLAGVFDLVVEEQDGNVAVIDHKVGKRRPIATEGGDLQLGLYAAAAEKVLKLDRTPRVGHQVVLRSRSATVETTIDTPPRQQVVEAVEAAIGAVELIDVAVQHKHPERLLGRRRSWRCGGCAYRRQCGAVE